MKKSHFRYWELALLLALTLALTPCLAGLAEEGNESQNSMDIVLMSGTEDGAGEGTGEGGSGAGGARRELP